MVEDGTQKKEEVTVFAVAVYSKRRELPSGYLGKRPPIGRWKVQILEDAEQFEKRSDANGLRRSYRKYLSESFPKSQNEIGMMVVRCE